jgi:1-deoxy-D-xylulose-5-phosphate reductoisomerase
LGCNGPEVNRVKKRVAVLGASGSIGRSTLDVLRAGREVFEPVLFSAHTGTDALTALAREFPCAQTVLTSVASRSEFLRIIGGCGADIVVNGIAGAAGLEPSLAALNAGADLALANKETIVMAAPLVFAAARKTGRVVIPVDSEHSAVFNLLRAHGDKAVDEIILTASGGPFRNHSLEELARVTVRDALSHPTWNMGPKITVDSASLANKGLEVIEAARLFDLPPSRIKVVIHRQSVVHSMIRLVDGAVYAQLSAPDMRLPIHEALYFPELKEGSFGRLDFDNLTLDFERPDEERFPMLRLAYAALRRGGLYPVVYNAANEEAVAAFLKNQIGFLDIPRLVSSALDKDWPGDPTDLETILATDKRSRRP